jgi:cyanophycinase
MDAQAARRSLKPFLLAMVTAWMMAVSPTANAAKPGTLVAIGGGPEDPSLMLDVLAVANGTNSRVVVLNTASGDPARSGPVYARFFRSLGVSDVTVLPLLDQDDAYRETNLGSLLKADLIYVTGGNQIKLVRAIANTPAHGAILAAFQRGAVVAGTSAGAMVWGPRFLAGGSSEAAWRSDDTGKTAAVALQDGLELVHEVLVDTHFAREGRIGRLLAACSFKGSAVTADRLIGVGIDEGTAAVLTHDQLRVFGKGRVTVLDPKEARIVVKDARLQAARDVTMHILGRGESLRWRRDEREKLPLLTQSTWERPRLLGTWLQGGTEGFVTQSRCQAEILAQAPDDTLIVAPDALAAAARQWQGLLQARPTATARVLLASQLSSPLLARYLPRVDGLIVLEDRQGGLVRALNTEFATLLKQHASHLRLLAIGPAVTLIGESNMQQGGEGAALFSGLRLIPGIIPSANLWAPGAFDRLTLDALLAGGATAIGLVPDGGVAIDPQGIRAGGISPTLIIDTSQVSMANPSLPSARDLKLHVLPPGERFTWR